MSDANNIPEPREPDGAVFTCAATFDQAELLGARWWQARLGQGAGGIGKQWQRSSAQADRRGFLVLGGILVGFAAIGGVAVMLRGNKNKAVTVDHDSLQLQRQQGWSYASTKPLQFADATAFDVDRQAPDALGLDLALRPKRADLMPFYVPTLFQALQQDSLLQVMRAIHSSAMESARDKGETLRRIFEQEPAAAATDVAVVVDLDGPESVAFAAGLMPRFDAVFTFDNWPHPLGVVPAHLTVGAALFYRPHFAQAAAAVRSPCFVLDRQRLHPVVSTDQFDNRYVAKLPSVDKLKQLGVRHVLYVTPVTSTQELDDLNETFVGWETAGIGVRRLSLADLAAWQPGSVEPKAGNVQSGPIYHGHPGVHWWFWHHYPFYGGLSSGRVAPAAPSSSLYRPQARSTMFGASGLVGGTAGTAGTTGAGQAGGSRFGRTTRTTRPSSSGGSWARGSGGGG